MKKTKKSNGAGYRIRGLLFETNVQAFEMVGHVEHLSDFLTF
jgi:hypothetical protein